MNKLVKARIRKMVMQELAKMVGEDALVSRGTDSHITGVEDDNYPIGEDVCEQCGGMAYEGQCMEAGCGGMSKRAKMLQEGDCGCGSSSSDESDYSIDTMGMVGDALGVLTHAGYEVDATKGHHKHHHNNYMAKPDLYKVAKYAKKLLHMIPDGYELDDWQRHKIAQISDDISEVYHSLDYDFHDDEY